MADPTIYRFTEALAVYGPALKELIHEEFGDDPTLTRRSPGQPPRQPPAR